MIRMLQRFFSKLGFLMIVPMLLLVSGFFACIYKVLTLLTPDSFHGLYSQSHAIDFLYFSLNTITTTGYGDIYPLTVTAKLLSVSEILVGLAAVILTVFYEVLRKKKNRREKAVEAKRYP